MTKHLMCWAHWRDVPPNLHRGSDEAIKAWAKDKQPVLRTAPARPFNEPIERE